MENHPTYDDDVLSLCCCSHYSGSIMSYKPTNKGHNSVIRPRTPRLYACIYTIYIYIYMNNHEYIIFRSIRSLRLSLKTPFEDDSQDLGYPFSPFLSLFISMTDVEDVFKLSIFRRLSSWRHPRYLSWASSPGRWSSSHIPSFCGQQEWAVGAKTKALLSTIHIYTWACGPAGIDS